MPNALVTTRYVTPGVYIGQLIKPSGGNLAADARICDYVGQGSRFAIGRNLAVRRSFVFGEALNLPKIPPYQSLLQHNANGVQDAPARVFDIVAGAELRTDQWSFVKIGPSYAAVVVAPEAFDPQASYHIDYQSVDSDILDPLPVGDLRNIISMGNNPDRTQYKDFQDFFVPFQFISPVPDLSNFIVDPFVTSIFPDAGNTGLGVVSQNGASDFNHNYNRFYELQVVSVLNNTPGSFSVAFSWKSVPYSGGIGALPPVPLNPAATAPVFNADQTNPPSLTQALELGVKVDITFDGVTNFNVGDKFYFNGVGPGIIEFNGRLTNLNQFLTYGTVVPTLQPGSTGALGHAPSTNFNGAFNTRYRLQCISSGGPLGARFATFVWAAYGEVLGANGTFSIVEVTPASLTQGLSNGEIVSLSFGAGNFAAGDQFDFEIFAPRSYYQAKDNRVLTLQVSTATNPGADAGAVVGSYSTGTPEGGFGSWTANINNLPSNNPNSQTGYFSLPDGLSLAVRNAMRGNVNGTSYASGDKFVGSATSENVLDWSLRAKIQETRDVTAVRTDVTGQVTGTAGSLYIILNNTYDTGSVEIVDSVSLLNVSFVELPGTRFIQLLAQPANTLIITYTFAGNEPVPGQLYYLTAQYLRPMNLYNSPQLVLDRQEGRTLLAPSTSTNHLYIMNELVFDNGAPGAYYNQPHDTDGDGSLSTTDVETALEAHAGVSRITDLCLLSLSQSLSFALQTNEVANDPFEKREQMLWVGLPIGTPIGDIDTEGSLIFTARRTLQTGPQSPARGTRVLVAPTFCTFDLTLENGSNQSVTLDGSFVAGATSALVNSFADPATTILRKNLTGFSTLQTYSDAQNALLGAASITYMSDQGNSVFRFEEDISVDSTDEIFQLISATTQKHYVVKVVRSNMDSSLISVVLPSQAAAVAFIRATLANILVGLLGRGILGSYQDSNGNPREFDPNRDVVILRDTSNLTTYDFFFAFWIRTPLKRLFGLYTVNTNDFGQVS